MDLGLMTTFLAIRVRAKLCSCISIAEEGREGAWGGQSRRLLKRVVEGTSRPGCLGNGLEQRGSVEALVRVSGPVELGNLDPFPMGRFNYLSSIK